MSVWLPDGIETILKPHEMKLLALARGFHRQFLNVTETKFVFCYFCLRKMCARDFEWHTCRYSDCGFSFQIFERSARIVYYCRTTFLQTMRLSIWHITSVLGKKCTKKIMETVLLTRDDFCLWYRENEHQRKKRTPKVKKGEVIRINL
jgi:hypothetical protein